VVVLLAEDTRDEAFFWISRRREREMEDELRKLKGVAAELERELEATTLDEFEGDADTAASAGDAGQPDAASSDTAAASTEAKPATNGGPRDSSLAEFAATPAEVASANADADPDATTDSEGVVATAGVDAAATDGTAETGAGADPEDTGDDPDVEVVVDQRELDSTIARDLSTRDGVRTRLETLAVGDYVLSDRVVVERKTVADFLDTLVGGDRSLFQQVRDMSRHYARPVVVIEGDGLYEERNIHPGAIRGALASLAVDFGVSVLHTRDAADTTELLATIATREQTERNRQVSVHGEKAAKTLDEQQEYVVSAIADVGPVTAQSLLAALGSVEAVMTATEEELQEVRGVGAKTARRIREVVGSDYAFEEGDEREGDAGNADSDSDE
jgi:Fanconi anemia group M protein